jgi:hypothetical protein
VRATARRPIRCNAFRHLAKFYRPAKCSSPFGRPYQSLLAVKIGDWSSGLLSSMPNGGNLLGVGDIVDGISGEHYKIGELSGLQRAPIVESEQSRRAIR